MQGMYLHTLVIGLRMGTKKRSEDIEINDMHRVASFHQAVGQEAYLLLRSAVSHIGRYDRYSHLIAWLKGYLCALSAVWEITLPASPRRQVLPGG